MKATHLFKQIIVLTILALASCKPEFKTTLKPSKGSADFTRYIAIGNSLTAGFSNDGLYLAGQKVAFPELIAQQLRSVGGGRFITPFFSANEANGSGYLKLEGFNADGSPKIEEVTSNTAVTSVPFEDDPFFNRYTGPPIDNYGIPGIKIADIDSKIYGNLNGYYERLLPEEPVHNTSYLDFVTSRPFTFFSMWLGNNDVLLYATHGGDEDLFGVRALTSKSNFSSSYRQTIDRLTANGAKGIVATVPDILCIPFFVTLTPELLLRKLKPLYPSANGIYIETGNNNVRVATNQDYITLRLPIRQLGQLDNNGHPYGLDPANPIEDEYVLDKDQAAEVRDYTQYYNNVIRATAAAKGLAIVDAYSILNRYKNVQIINGIPASSTFLVGNVFSLDGIHLTPFGNALIANAFIEAINEKYGSTIPSVNVSAYQGIAFP